MIYLPLEVQLSMIREDLRIIKDNVCDGRVTVSCKECEFARSTGMTDICTNHAPEFAAWIQLPL